MMLLRIEYEENYLRNKHSVFQTLEKAISDLFKK